MVATSPQVTGNFAEYERHPMAPETEGYLDWRSYHAFAYRDRGILYDIGTGAVLSLAPEAAALLHDARSMQLADLRAKYADHEDLLSEVEILREAGMFAYEGAPTDDEAERYFETLVNHPPRRIQLFVAQACNLACRYCYAEEQGSNAKNKLMSFETAKTAVDHLVRMSANRPDLSIQFFGGEALLNFALIKQVVEYCGQLEETTGKRFHFQISTNGILLTDEIRQFIVKHRFASLISVDGDREAHDRNRVFRNGSGSYDRVVENALKLQEDYRRDGQHVEQLKIRATANHQNSSLMQISTALEAAGFKYIGIGSVDVRPFSPEPTLTPQQVAALDVELEQFLDRLVEAVQRRQPIGYNPFKGTLANLENQSRYFYGIMCGVGRNTNAVDVDGHIYPCHRYVGMDAYVIGNVNTGLDREAVRAYYRAAHYTARPKCASCWARRLCGGLCTWTLSHASGDIWRAPEETCKGIRKGLEQSLYLYEAVRAQQGDAAKELVTAENAIGPDADGQRQPRE